MGSSGLTGCEFDPREGSWQGRPIPGWISAFNRKRNPASYAYMAPMDEVATLSRRRDGRADGSGQADEFEAFFADHHDPLFRALRLLTRNRLEAVEIMQDAFLALWPRWESVATGPDAVGYLYRTAMNLWRSRLRRAAVAVRKAVHQIPPDDEMAAVEQRDAVVRALGPLPPRQRAAVVLMDVLDLSSERAGEMLRVRPATVRVLAARGRARLAKEMRDRDD
jgi:RNA polymerase sigma factor (sigma-70 family)